MTENFIESIKGAIQRLAKEYNLDDFYIEVKYNKKVNGAEINLDRYREKQAILEVSESISRYNIDTVLRHEILHLCDAINNEFGFDYEYLRCKTCKSKLAELVWDISINNRLSRNGFQGADGIESGIESFIQETKSVGYINVILRSGIIQNSLECYLAKGNFNMQAIKDITKLIIRKTEMVNNR